MGVDWIMGLVVLVGALAAGYFFALPVLGSLYRQARQKLYARSVGQGRTSKRTVGARG